MAWNSLPDFIRDPTSSTECFRRLLDLGVSVDLKHKIDGFLKISYRYSFTKEIFHILSHDLFNKVKASNHCLSLITSSTTTP